MRTKPNNPRYTIRYTDVSDETTRAQIATQIKTFNNARSPFHLQIRTKLPTPLELYVHDQNRTLLGGLIAETYWGWLFVDMLWLHEHVRGHGLGRDLLLRAETEAIRRGCAHAYLTTFSFQARGFYEKQGYRVVGQLDDYPPGDSYFWLRKDFIRDSSNLSTEPATI